MENQDLTEIFHKQDNLIDLEYAKEKEEVEKVSNIIVLTDHSSSSDTCQDLDFVESKIKEFSKEKEDAVDSRICDKLKEVTTKVISSRPVLDNISEKDNQQSFAIIINKCLSVYNQEMQANIMKQVFYFDDILLKLHHKSHGNALKCFKESCMLENKYDLMRYKEELINLMEESFKRISYHNSETRERLCEHAQAQSLQKYKILMEKSLLDEENENDYVQHSKFVKYSKFAEHEAKISFLDFCGRSDEIENNCESLGFKEEMKKLKMSILMEMKKYEDMRRLKKVQVEKQMDQKVEIFVKIYKDEFERKLKTSTSVSPMMISKDEFKQIHTSLRESVLNDFKKETLTSILGSKYAEKLDEKLRGQYTNFKKIAFKGHYDMVLDQTKVKLSSSIEKIESILNDSKAVLDDSSVSCVTLEMHILKLEKVLKLLEY